MGFTIFESSGTFNPADYGLSIGDLIHLIVVGGGGGGAGTANLYTAGTAGNASSFGNILTAAGGLAPSDKNSVTPSPGSFRGANGVSGKIGIYKNYSGGTVLMPGYSVFGGGGADGWLPGVCKGRSGMPSTQFAYANHLFDDSSQIGGYPLQDNFGHTVIFGYMDALISYIPASNQRGGSGGIYIEHNEPVQAIGGSGGLGYGAGGGGGATGAGTNPGAALAGAGGNSGVIAQKDHVLTSLNPVSVTVGTGGSGGTGYRGGEGANGCVAIFW